MEDRVIGEVGGVITKFTASRIVAQFSVIEKVQFTLKLVVGTWAIAHSLQTDRGIALSCPEAPYELWTGIIWAKPGPGVIAGFRSSIPNAPIINSFE